MKWIAKIIRTIMITAFFVIAVLIFCMVISLPLMLSVITHNLLWLLIYIAMLPILLIKE